MISKVREREKLRSTCCLCTLCVNCANVRCKITVSSVRHIHALLWRCSFRAVEQIGKIVQWITAKDKLRALGIEFLYSFMERDIFVYHTKMNNTASIIESGLWDSRAI